MAPMTHDEALAFNSRAMEEFRLKMGHHKHVARGLQQQHFVDFHGFGEVNVFAWGLDGTFWMHTHHAAALTGLEEGYILHLADEHHGGWDEHVARVIPWAVRDKKTDGFKVDEAMVINEIGLHRLMNDERCPWRREFLTVMAGGEPEMMIRQKPVPSPFQVEEITQAVAAFFQRRGVDPSDEGPTINLRIEGRGKMQIFCIDAEGDYWVPEGEVERMAGLPGYRFRELVATLPTEQRDAMCATCSSSGEPVTVWMIRQDAVESLLHHPESAWVS